jgi:hypothetical protein
MSKGEHSMKSKLANLASLAKGTAEVAKAKALEAASHMPSKNVIADTVESTPGKLAAAIRRLGPVADAGGTRDTESM